MKRILPLMIALAISSSAFSHGYILNSRAKLCAQGVNHSCGPVIWEPQSVEGPDRFPSSGPADGTIAAAGSSRWVALNEQTPTRWHKVEMEPGLNTFNWHFTAPHVTKDWRYFITKQNWNQSQPLTRNSFELNPFCSYPGHFQRPPSNISHECDVPIRSGYQIILGVWDVGDTSSSFYHIIDAMMSDDGTPPSTSDWKDVGDINPSSDLYADDIVRVRMFSDDGELGGQAIELVIENEEQGMKNTWPKLLAEHINAQGADLLAGIEDAQGNIVPVFGKNDVFADESSIISRVEIDVDLAEVSASLEIDLHQSSFSADETMSLIFDVSADPEMDITAELFYQGARIGYQEALMVSSTQMQIDVENPQAGDYQLIVIGETEDQQHNIQESFAVTVTDPSGLVYPDNRGNYATGDQIRGQDGNMYQCLIANWCNGSGTYYAPGLGLAWNSAWALLSQGPAPTVKEFDFSYPQGRGQYQQGTTVKGTDSNLYRCNIPGWCNSSSSFYYAPGTGLAWDSAWSAL